MHKQKPRSGLWISLLLASLASCSFGSKPHNRLPNDGPTTQEAYEDHLAAAGQHAARTEHGFAAARAALTHDMDPSAWTRHVDNELSLRFPRIPNPELVGYVFPHLSGQGHPVPGYATQFPLHESVHYALPGEVPPGRGPASGAVHD